MFTKRLLAILLCAGFIAVPLIACDSSDLDEEAADKYCQGKQDGADCDENINFCFCYQGKSIAADPILCHEYPCSDICLNKNTTESCGDGMICDPQGSCIEPKPYKP